MAPPPTDPTIVAEALRRVAGGQHRDDVARDLTAEGRDISSRTIRRAQAAAKPPAPPVPPPLPKPAKPPRPATKAARRLPAPAAKPLPPPPAPVALLPDVLDELRGFLALTKGQLEAAAGRQGYAAIGQLADKLAARIAAIEVARRPAGGEGAAILARGPAALAKIRAGRGILAARELASGDCAACGGKLSEEQLLERRARVTP